MNCLENLSLENDSISVNICVLMLNQIRTYICLVIEMFVLFFIFHMYIYSHTYTYNTHIHIHVRMYIPKLIALFCHYREHKWSYYYCNLIATWLKSAFACAYGISLHKPQMLLVSLGSSVIEIFSWNNTLHIRKHCKT